MISEDAARAVLSGKTGEQSWAVGRAPDLSRIFNVFSETPSITGPTLDIGSGGAAFFRLLQAFKPVLLPYSCADLGGQDLLIDDTVVKVHPFECDKDRIPTESESFGLVLLCDVLEHLLVDPVWTLLEINRVLKLGGHLVVSTPNVTSINRIVMILSGLHPGTENQYKPTCLYDRHNREWTPSEVVQCCEGLGFRLVHWDSNFRALSEDRKQFVAHLIRTNMTTVESEMFGPDLVFVFQKEKHVTLESELDEDKRWPAFLYTGYSNYHQRPKVFPIKVA